MHLVLGVSHVIKVNVVLALVNLGRGYKLNESLSYLKDDIYDQSPNDTYLDAIDTYLSKTLLHWDS
jgi:hypothetical protein